MKYLNVDPSEKPPRESKNLFGDILEAFRNVGVSIMRFLFFIYLMRNSRANGNAAIDALLDKVCRHSM